MRESKHVLAKKPWHILAKPEDVAERVIVAGDPLRVSRISKLLEEPKLVNEHRGYLVYTGKYKGIDVSIATHGIGAPSAAIVFEELLMLGARIMVRLGTCGGLKDYIELGSVVVPIGALYEPGGTIGMYTQGCCYPAVADPEVVLKLEEKLEGHGFKVFRGLAASSDAFHAEEEYSKKWSGLNAIAVEMECATLFTLARLKGFKAGAALMVIDNLATGEAMKADTVGELADKTVKAILDAIIEV